jgi:imidazoleglycerol phosphate dehydratase HisB
MTKEEALALLKQENVIKNNNKKILEAAFKALNQALKKPEVEENDEE